MWHWSPECSQWPKAALDGEEVDTRPSFGDMCSECRKLQPRDDEGSSGGERYGP